jgi:hypothetical protein
MRSRGCWSLVISAVAVRVARRLSAAALPVAVVLLVT